MDEDQFILRLPPELAERMRLALASKAKRDAAGPPSSFSITFSDCRNATFTLDDNQYPATLMDLPCVSETHKFTEKRTFYKSGDIGQVLVVRYPGEPAPQGILMPDGLTPGSKGAAHRFAVPDPVFSPEQVSAVENTIKCIIDNKLAFVRKKSDSENPATPTANDQSVQHRNDRTEGNKVLPPSSHLKDNDEEIEIVIEHPDAVNAVAEGISVETGKSARAPSEFRPTSSTDVAGSNAGAVASSPASVPSEAVGTPSAGGPATPQPSPQPDPDGEDDNDDFDNELADLMLENDEAALVKSRIARAELTKRIDAKKAQITEQEGLARRAPNAVLKQRHNRKRGELEAELATLDEELSKLG